MSPILTASRKIPAMQTMRIIITGVSSPVAAAPLAAPSSPPGTTGIKSKNRILQLMYGKCFKILNTFLLKFSIRTRLYEAQLSFNHGLKPRLISALLNRVVRSSIIF